MYSRLVIEGNAVYEIDEDCAREKQVPRGFGNKRREPGRVNPPGVRAESREDKARREKGGGIRKGASACACKAGNPLLHSAGGKWRDKPSFSGPKGRRADSSLWQDMPDQQQEPFPPPQQHRIRRIQIISLHPHPQPQLLCSKPPPMRLHSSSRESG